MAVIGIGLLIAVLALTQLGLFLPMVLVAAYAFLSIHLDGLSVLDFLSFVVSFYMTEQQIFRVGGTSMRKKKDKRRQSTQDLLGVKKITDYCISTDAGDLVFYIIKPTNISVLPAECGQCEDPRRCRTHSAHRLAWSCWR